MGRAPRVLGSSGGFGHQGWGQLECNGKQNSLVPKKGGGHEIEASQHLELSIERGCRLDFGDITCQLLTATICRCLCMLWSMFFAENIGLLFQES